MQILHKWILLCILEVKNLTDYMFTKHVCSWSVDICSVICTAYMQVSMSPLLVFSHKLPVIVHIQYTMYHTSLNLCWLNCTGYYCLCRLENMPSQYSEQLKRSTMTGIIKYHPKNEPILVDHDACWSGPAIYFSAKLAIDQWKLDV